MTSEDHKDIADRILKITPTDKRDSLIFKTLKERDEYINSVDYKVVEDENFLDRLSKINKLSIENKEETNDKK